MAATDQAYRNQKALDIVFAVSGLLMLASIIWMFADDYYREYKTEQRQFRDVESALAQRIALQKLPSVADFKKAKMEVENARKERNKKENQERGEELAKQIRAILPDKERSEQRFQSIQADLASRTSFYDLAVDEYGPQSDQAKRYKEEVFELKNRLVDQQAETDTYIAKLKDIQREKETLEQPLNQAEVRMKKVNEGFDLQVRTALLKQWGLGDTIRSLPVLDAFNSPTKIQQFTLNDLPIDYNFKYVTRFDRCTSCHKGIDRPAYARANLEALLDIPKGLDRKLRDAQIMLRQRKEALAGTEDASKLPDPDQLEITTLSPDVLTPGRITEFAAHPRIDLFAGPNSKHPAEKFGCTICHSGQGSATSFALASHTPNDAADQQSWKEAHAWMPNHDWEFPMLPSRFVDSSCLKCHHNVTDLISSQGNRAEAPKLLRGYNLIKDNGCFGCHEIQGFKDGRSIGPDLRVEPTPPLEKMSAAELARVTADPNNPPGNLRKVGPSLYRLSEKTNKEWVVKWLRAPRAFRPDTKMPHYYGLTNNNPHQLSDEFKGPSQLPKEQKDLPDTEIHAIAHFLFTQSNSFLEDVKKHHAADAAVKAKDQARLTLLEGKGRLTDDEKKEMDKLVELDNLRQSHGPIHDLPLSKDYDASKAKERGRQLFSERGCLACHSHEATQTPGEGLPALPSEAQFGPNLSQIKAKLGTKPGDMASARRWLMYWIKDPHVHSRRSRMPVTHLTNEEIADVAAWLLAQEPVDLGEGWATLDVPEPDARKLDQLARVYLERLLSQKDLNELEKKRTLPPDRVGDLPEEEQKVVKDYNEENIKFYLGKKSVGRMGCFGCHDIPGFDNAKQIGVPLLDWGKKDPGRLAFEDIDAFVEDNFRVVESLAEKRMPTAKGGKPAYDAFFAEALHHHTREGFLHQKVLEPRSYDYHRLRLWDDRSRMPQFKFARTHKKAGESPEAFRARATREEAEAREAVMTFILGLVGEPIPLPYLNRPGSDRLAEVKGRQVIDTYNCAGCHLIQPGTFAFKVNDQTLPKLEKTFVQGKDGREKDYDFLNHHDWAGSMPASPDRLIAYGARPRYDEEDKAFLLTLTQALRFQGADGDMHDIRSSSTLSLPPSEMISPSPEVAVNRERLAAQQKMQGPLGGTFADLLVNYLVKRSPKEYKRDSGDPADEHSDSADARVASPPLLIGQGERTQTEWLFRFLLDPPRIRKMTVLRMPKFNMSQDEARALVNYFAAVTRISNSGLGLTYPYASVPQQADFTDPYWRQKTAAYVARLKAGGGAEYRKRALELQPRWEQILKEYQGQLKDAKEKLTAAAARAEEVKKKQEQEAAVKEAESARSAWEGEVKRLSDAVASSSVDKQRAAWEQNEAYLIDAFKLVANRDLCLGCHGIGGLEASKPPQEQGPPLSISFERLRPGWTQRWVANPQRYLTYPSIMPQNFLANKRDYQHLFVGSPLEQVTAVRDVMMVYPRAAELPLNRQWMLPSGTGEKK